jgi:hypothetical protein
MITLLTILFWAALLGGIPAFIYTTTKRYRRTYRRMKPIFTSNKPEDRVKAVLFVVLTVALVVIGLASRIALVGCLLVCGVVAYVRKKRQQAQPNHEQSAATTLNTVPDIMRQQRTPTREEGRAYAASSAR